jgi:ABC-type multidrug transport system fused ATPase/permease subunit
MGLAGVGWVAPAYPVPEYQPDKSKIGIESSILINLPGIMASTMLTVATFSVAAMVSSYGSVATTATPRATRIVMAERTTQNSLTSFLSVFIYPIVALVAISLGNYDGAGGRLLLFVGYCIMVGWVLISFVRWVDRLSRLGRMGDALERVEEACHEAFSSPESMGTLGAKRARDAGISGTEVKSDPYRTSTSRCSTGSLGNSAQPSVPSSARGLS